MAANINREGSYRSKFLVQAPHFFKVIVFPFHRGLKIPDAFMRKHGRDLGDIVMLKVPTGASWQVELVHYGNGTRLQKGWPEFANYYSIEKLYFLVFRYEGNSQFHVLIFDPTAMEVEYPFETNNCNRSGSLGRTATETEYPFKANSPPPTNRASKGKRVRVEDAEEDVSLVILEDLPEAKSIPRQRTRYSQSPSKEKHHPERKNSGNMKAKPNQDENADESFMGTRRPSSSRISISKIRIVIDKQKLKSYKKAMDFRSSNPFFISFMYPSYFLDPFYLTVPANFAKAYFATEDECEVMLHVPGKTREWPVILNVCGLRRRFYQGWKNFAVDNGLKAGDVCVFELVCGTRKFNITVYRCA